MSWSRNDLKLQEWILRDEVYDVAILVQTGTTKTQAFFVLHNEGSLHTGLKLADSPRRLSESRALFGLS